MKTELAHGDTMDISTHALREEGDQSSVQTLDVAYRFLPTPSARRATPALSAHRPGSAHFYPRPPRGGRPSTPRSSVCLGRFLPTPSARRATHCSTALMSMVRGFLPTPSARRATGVILHFPQYRLFLPTPSARRATGQALSCNHRGGISTHALREEGDSKCAIKQKLFSGSICTMRYSPRKKRAVFVQAALSLERSLHV